MDLALGSVSLVDHQLIVGTMHDAHNQVRIYGLDGRLRRELSLPISIGEDGHIDVWRERIVLGPIPLDGDFVEIVPPVQPDITIDVRRRA